MSSQDKTAVQPVGGKTADKVFRGVAYACGILILVVLAAVFLFLFFRAWPLIGGDQAANSQTVSSFTGGKASSFWGYVLPLLFGTVLVSLLALLIAFFVSIGIALFISHYAPKKLATALSYVVDLLAAIPSVIYGLLGILILNPLMYKMELAVFKGSSTHQYTGGANLISAVLVLALMILPTVINISESALRAVPGHLKSASLALGATKIQTIFQVILPAAKSGIITAVVLGTGRAIGEAMAITLVSGSSVNFPLPFNSVRFLTTAIVAEMGYASGLHREVLFTIGLVLFAFIMIINIGLNSILKKGEKTK